MITEAICRIQRMEQYLDTLQAAAAVNPAAILEDPSLKRLLQYLLRYYETGQWLRDYELDEKGLLPQTLKRGVLAQDTLHDFFDRILSNPYTYYCTEKV